MFDVKKLKHHFHSIWQIKNNQNAYKDAPSVLFKLLHPSRLVSHFGVGNRNKKFTLCSLNSSFFFAFSLRFSLRLTLLYQVHHFITHVSYLFTFEEKSKKAKKNRTNEPCHISTRIYANYHYFESIVHAWFPMNESTSNKQIYYYNLVVLWINMHSNDAVSEHDTHTKKPITFFSRTLFVDSNRQWQRKSLFFYSAREKDRQVP